MANATLVLGGNSFAPMYNISVDDFFSNVSNISVLGDNLTTLAPPATKIGTLFPHVQKIVYDYLGPVICAFGILCNIINIAVLMQHQLKESPYTYLTGLALTDLGALTFSFIFMVVSRKNPTAYFWRFYEAYIFIPLSNVCTTSSVWIVVLLTIERFLFVRHPLWAKATCDRASAKFKNALLVWIAFLLNIPRFMIFEVGELRPGVYYLKPTDFRRSDHNLVINWFYSILVHFLPLVILWIANTYLLYAVMQARKQREQLQIRNNKEAAWAREQVRLTVTLISIICLFIICIIPSAFADYPIAYALFGGDQTEAEFRFSDFYRILQYVANALVWCNLSLNFVLYCAFNEKFRRVMRLMIQRCIKKIRYPNRKSTILSVSFNKTSNSRKSSTLTNSISLQTKCSLLPGQEKADKGDNSQTTALFDKSEKDMD